MESKLGFLLVSASLFACSGSGEDPLKEVQIVNTADVERKEVVTLDLSDVNLNGKALDLSSGDKSIPFEVLDDNQVRFLTDIEPGQQKTIVISNSDTEAEEPEKLTQAEISVKKGGEWKERKYIGGAFENVQRLSVPQEHTDHSFYIRYEGPGWESNLVGYRFYLDWRNGIDIFGKKTNEMVLQNVGQDNFDSYHEENDWGMDILKVGKSLGLGSIGRHLNDSLYRFQEVDSVYSEVSENGLLRSAITTRYYNWKTENDSTDLTSVISIEGESRLSKHELTLSNPLAGFCTGLVINEDEEYIDKSLGAYRLLATYGDFSLNNDQMGMAIIVRNDQVADVFDDAYSHVVTFKPQRNLTYYFLATWEKEPNGIKDLASFRTYLDEELLKINNPIRITSVSQNESVN